MKSLKEYFELLTEKDSWDEKGQYLGNGSVTSHKKKILKTHSKTYPKKPISKSSDHSSSNDLASTLWNKMAYGDKSKPSNLKSKGAKPKPKLSDSSSAFDKGLKAAQSQPNALAAKTGTEARDKARQMGLEYYGFGYWGRNDKVLYHTEGGELKPVNSKHYVVTAQKKHAHKSQPSKDSYNYKAVPSTTPYDKLYSHAAKVEKSLTKKEKYSLDEYVNSSSGINAQLAQGNKPDWNDWSSDIKNLDNIMKKSKMPEDVTVYRGIPSINLARKMIEELKKSNFIHIPTFMSTSFSPDAARGFQSYNNYMVIKISAGSSALPVHYSDDRSGFEGEYEVILPRDSVLKLVRVEKRKGMGADANYRFIFELQ